MTTTFKTESACNMPPQLNPNIERIVHMPAAERQAFVNDLPAHEVIALVDHMDQILPFVPAHERPDIQAALGFVPNGIQAPRPDPPQFQRPPLRPEAQRARPAANVHRHGADQDTRASIGRMVATYPIPRDVTKTLEAVDAFITNHFGNPAHSNGAALREDGSFSRHEGPLTLDDADALNAALRTTSKDRFKNEYFGGIRDDGNTYILELDGVETIKPTSHVVAALWTATEHLANRERLEVRLNIARAFASAQQDGVHVCAPGQLQLVATHMQSAYPELIDIRTPPKDPEDFSAQLYRFVVLRSAENGPLLEAMRQEVLDKATELWNEAEQQDAGRVKKNWLTPDEYSRRALELFQGFERLLNDTYNLEWALPASAENLLELDTLKRHAIWGVPAAGACIALPHLNIFEVSTASLAWIQSQATHGNQRNAAKAMRKVFLALKLKSKVLDLSQLGLSTLPPFLNQLTDLTSLNMEGNKLALRDFSGLPPRLEELNLANNSLTCFACAPESNSLKILNLQTNELVECDVSHLSQLENLNLGGNRLTSIDITNLRNLSILSLSCNRFREFDPSPMRRLKKLYIAANPLSDSEKNRIRWQVASLGGSVADGSL